MSSLATDPPPPRPPHESSRLRTLVEIPVLAVIAVVATLVLKATVAQAFYIPSASMEPQLREHDRVIVSRLAYRLHEPRRGDVIVFRDPNAPPDDRGLLARWADDLLETVALKKPGDEQLIKRVVGLPGEEVTARGGRVIVDGRVLEEPYLPPDSTTADFDATIVPEDHVFVLGDNRGDSHDSRFGDVGAIPYDAIVGRAIMRAWPPGRAAYL